MIRPSFDVLGEPWIPVVRLDGSADEFGILRCLEQAHNLREIKDSSPIVEFGLYRLLVAFVLDALILAHRRPEDHHDLEDLIEEGSFDGELLAAYVEACGDVFDLFHPDRPFLQTVMAGNEKKRPVAGVFPAVPSGTNVCHWRHPPEALWDVSPAEATRLLATIAPFMTAGGSGLSPSINGAPAVYILPLGRNVYETVVLNLPLRADQEAGDGTAAWRSTSVPGRERVEATTVEALTWRPRRIQLVAEVQELGDGLRQVRVRHMRFARGDSTRLTWIDGNLAYRYDHEKVTPVRMRAHRALWRDAGPLLFLDDLEHGSGQDRVSFKRPDVVSNAFKIGIDNVLTRIHAYGMRTDMKMKVFEWTKAVWKVPPSLGRSTRLGAVIFGEMDRAERAAWALRTSIRSLYPREGASSQGAMKSTSERCERAYWQALEPRFTSLLNAVAHLDPAAPDDPDLVAETTRKWREAIRSLAVEQFEWGAKDMDADGDALERMVRARGRLVGNLRRVLS